MWDLNEEKVKQMAAAAAEAGREAVGIACDVSDESSIEAMITQVAELFGTVDVVVNCAGILSSTKIPDIKRCDWDKMLAVNLSGTFFTIQKAWPYLIKADAAVSSTFHPRPEGWEEWKTQSAILRQRAECVP